MHGAGNHFVVVDGFKEKLPQALRQLAKTVCHPQFGVGADGLVLILPSRAADFRMRIFNPDGTEAEMCGNGIRCFAKYVFDRKLTRQKKFTVETPAGIVVPEVFVNNREVSEVRVDMGEPRFSRAEIPMRGKPTPIVLAEKLPVAGKKYEITCVSMGNPHCMTFIKDVSKIDLAELGPKFERHPVFPKRTNVEFIQVLSRKKIRVRVWERGAGPTLACGSGACASVVGSVLNSRTDRNVSVHLPGGVLHIHWLPNNHVLMTGPAKYVFEGKFPRKFPEGF